MGGHAFLVQSQLLQQACDLLEARREEVVYIVGGGNGQVPCMLGEKTRVIIAEPDPELARYLDSLGLYRAMIINADPTLVLGDMPYDKIVSFQPGLITHQFIEELLKTHFKTAYLIIPDKVLTLKNGRNKLGVLLKGCLDFKELKHIPGKAFSPPVKEKMTFVCITPKDQKNPVSASLQLLVREAGTMRGLLTRICRVYFDYTLAEAQEAVRMLDASLLKKRFWDVTEKEFKEIHEWIKLG